MSAVQQQEVGITEADWRFDRWVRHHFPDLGHSTLQKLMRTGQFRLDGKRVHGNERVQAGQIVRVPPLTAAPAPLGRPAATASQLRPGDEKLIRQMVVHEDELVIVLNKPAGLAVQGGTRTTRHVDGMLAALARGGDRPRLCHRLDRDTSGVLVVARTAKAAGFLTSAFRGHEARKLYWAVVVGNPRGQEGLIDLALAKRGVVEKMSADDDGKPSRTRWRVILRTGKLGAWLGLMPLTGRTHQLRAHCAAMGWPILGDGKYGGATAHPASAPKGLMLHAREIDMPHPGGGRLRVSAEAPPVFIEGLRWLGIGPEPLPFSRLADWPR